MAGFQVIMYGRFWVFTEVMYGEERDRPHVRPLPSDEIGRVVYQAKEPLIGDVHVVVRLSRIDVLVYQPPVPILPLPFPLP